MINKSSTAMKILAILEQNELDFISDDRSRFAFW